MLELRCHNDQASSPVDAFAEPPLTVEQSKTSAAYPPATMATATPEQPWPASVKRATFDQCPTPHPAHSILP
jgi:hypothetical protein